MNRLLLAALLAAAAGHAQAADWTTPAEAAHFRTTPSYADTVAYLHKLADAAPGKLKVESFGTSPQGRPMTVVIASGDGTFTPEAAHRSGKPVVLVQAGIHPGEIEGKDAGLMLLRDFAVSGKLPHLLDHAVLVFIPVFSVDGHENSSPYHRINQNGPDSMGFRGQSQYLNLNRDYVKADAPEMRDWLKLWQRWQPDLLMDIHTTDGADYQYDLTWYLEDPHKLDAGVSAWQQRLLNDKVIPAYEKRGHLASIYLEFKDGRDPRKGIVNFGSGPRFSTGYAALQNRPALLVETHMLKSYEVRVRGTYDLVALMLEQTGADAANLLAINRKADEAVVARARDAKAQVALTFKDDPASTPFKFKGYEFSLTHSDVSNSEWIRYDPSKPRTYDVQNWNGLLPDASIAPPAAYVIPAQWTQAIDKLDAHGIAYRRLARPEKLKVQAYQLDKPQWASKPFEGHLMLRDFAQSSTAREVELPAGSVIVPMDQRAANVAIELLEPQAPDSLLHWGFLDAVFEPKEYGEPRVLEKLARDMMAKDPALKAAFEQKLREDAAFAASPSQRLFYFFERSPWYTAQDVGAYPVYRIDAATLQGLVP
ncbi:peptidase M14 [Dyella sp. LX-66]|uniref:M14 family metallopeptidase n=1 Tax=unclassified Dyella TaxID=2634549 RepID=UPI001BE0659C|nr:MULTISPECIES: M14 family metallopeptidase [unclassified Dyella]MBT2119095.1 peptidase M14 [Dyella sp. LX-1]MBT2140431.1 peptidase M14 [Dyella sp. LX-66]